MSNPDVSELRVPAHFTNIQQGLQIGPAAILAAQDTPNRQVILITDGLPTAHFEGKYLYLLYPPDPRTEAATLREGQLCQREQITINIFLLPTGRSRAKTCSSPTGWPNRPRAGSFSPPAKTSTATCSGTISSAAARSWRSR